jgi:hypothetical protein
VWVAAGRCRSPLRVVVAGVGVCPNATIRRARLAAWLPGDSCWCGAAVAPVRVLVGLPRICLRWQQLANHGANAVVCSFGRLLPPPLVACRGCSGRGGPPPQAGTTACAGRPAPYQGLLLPGDGSVGRCAACFPLLYLLMPCLCAHAAACLQVLGGAACCCAATVAVRGVYCGTSFTSCYMCSGMGGGGVCGHRGDCCHVLWPALHQQGVVLLLGAMGLWGVAFVGWVLQLAAVPCACLLCTWHGAATGPARVPLHVAALLCTPSHPGR